MKRLSILIILLISATSIFAQMSFQGQSLFGNEWVDHSKTYVKFNVSEDGIYRVDYQSLVDNGFPANIKGREIQMYSMGVEVALHVSKVGEFSNGDYIEFYGQKNRGQLDQTVYDEWTTQQLNPDYSMFTDERTYFITWATNTNNNLRFETLDNDLGGTVPQVEPIYLHEEKIIFNENHLRPVINDQDVRYSNFFTTEGFGSVLKKKNTVSIPADNIATSFPNSKLNVRFGTNAGNHVISFDFNDKFLENNSYIAYVVEEKEFDIETSELNQNNTFVIEGNASSFDRNTVAYASITYPRNFVANSQSEFRFPFPNHSFKKYFEIKDYNAQGGTPIVIDVVNNVRLESEFSGGTVKFVLPAASSARDIFIYNSPETISNFETVSFVNYENIDPQYVILTSRVLDSTAEGENMVRKYSDFRSSDAGGSYDVEIVHVEDVIDQFGYGIKNHTIGIKNWSNYMIERWNNWDFAFILGKSYEYGIIREDVPGLINHIPTHGEPGSDHLSFSLGDNSYPEVAVGRLAAKSGEEINTYLEKVKTYSNLGVWDQSIAEKAWTKKVVHLSGGDVILQPSIKTWLADMGDVITNSTFGAEVETFAKTSSDPVQNSLSQSIINSVDEGCSILTFFGHSAVGTFDFSIEDPSQFNNYGKTPIIISLGCHSGNIHTTAFGISEDFVLEPEKGAIAFLASSGTAYVGPQYVHGKEFYQLLGEEFYGKEIGIVLKEVMQGLTNNLDFQVETLQQQLTLHGDPALVINAHQGPDYTPDFTTFKTDPEVVSGRLDSFDICFDIVNLGRDNKDTLNYYLVHKYGSNKIDSSFYQVIAPKNRMNRCHTLPINVIAASGKNNIEVYLDHNEQIDEVPNPRAEMNNSIYQAYQEEGYTFFVLNDNPIPFSPDRFSITNDENVTLMATTGNAFVGVAKYDIEIDTTELFDSPLKQSAQIEAHGGLIKWQPNIDYQEEQVYYWRVRSANPEFDVFFWNTSSFIHMDEYENGWNQSHLYQFLKDDYRYLEVDSTTRDFEYTLSSYEFKIVNQIYRPENFPSVSINQDFIEGYYGNDIPGGIYMVIVDSLSFNPIICPKGGQLGADTPLAWRDRKAWPFSTQDAEQRAEIVNFLENELEDGLFIFMFTVQTQFNDYKPGDWEEDLFKVFEDEGATRIRELVDNPRPYVFAFQKGMGLIEEYIADESNEIVTALTTVEGKWFEGNMFSTTIGPAKSWNKFLWDFEEFDQEEDLYNISLYGLKDDNTRDTIATNITNKEFDLTTISADQYPNLQLEIFTRDTLSNTALDLDFWRIVYKPLPEALINTNDQFSFQADTLQQGEQLKIEYLIENISDSNMDSILVNYEIIDKQNNTILNSERKAPVQAQNTISDQWEYTTDNMNGRYQLRVEINPDNDQPEQFDFNNLGIINFLVRGDDVNPVLDVTFDGIRILDGDIISPKPLIKITLTDDNTSLLMENPEDFQIVLERPDGTLEEIDVNSADINFIPAVEGEDENRACLEFSPSLTEGEYIIYIQGKDASGNFSGDHEFTVSFKVFEDNLISNVINYPNPFSNSTQFIFTITGDQLPDNYHIKIMTLSGKVVREITQSELGPIRIGQNRSDYKWDGRDEYGSKLANGVYIYKFYTDMDNDFDKFELGDLDQYFTKGFGKLVIMR